VETNREEIKGTSKDAADRWYKAGLGEIRDNELGRKSGRMVTVKTLEEL